MERPRSSQTLLELLRSAPPIPPSSGPVAAAERWRLRRAARLDGLGDRERSLSPDSMHWDDIGLQMACEDLWDEEDEEPSPEVDTPSATSSRVQLPPIVVAPVPPPAPQSADDDIMRMRIEDLRNRMRAQTRERRSLLAERQSGEDPYTRYGQYIAHYRSSREIDEFLERDRSVRARRAAFTALRNGAERL